MKCPACETDVPSGRSACEHCGTPFPSAGEPPGPPPRFASGSPKKRRPWSPNPKTEPLPVWDADEEPPWDRPADGPMPDAASPGHRPGGWAFGVSELGTTPVGPARWNPETPWAGPRPMTPPPGPDPNGWDQGIPPFAGDPAASRDSNGWDQGVPPFAGDPAASPADGQPAGKRKMLLLAGGIAAAVVLVGGLTYTLTQGSQNKPAASTAQPGVATAARQAAAVDQVLRSGTVAHGHLPSRLRTCDEVAAGVSGFQRVVQDRREELSRSMGLRVDRLQDGARLRRSMIVAYRSSLAADQAYLAWAQDVQARSCGGRIAPLTAHYKDAVAADDKAGPAKRQVVALWNPIAGGQGLPTYAWNNL